jgi:hypothetical protein
MPKILDRCVERLMDNPDFTPKDGTDKRDSAYAVCVASLQKAGILKKGTTELTDKGKDREAEMAAAASAILANLGNLTFRDVEESLRDALHDQFKKLSPAGEQIGEIPWIVDVLWLDNYLVYRYEGKDWRAPFTMNDDYTATIGKGTPVVQAWIEATGDPSTDLRAGLYWRGEDGAEHPALVPVQAAVWSTAFVNDLPDSAFLYIEPGGSADDEGKTKPRSLRHFPYKGKEGEIDLPHLRNALARIPQSTLPDDVKDRVLRRAKRIARANGIETEASRAAGDPASISDGIPDHYLRFPLRSRAGRGGLAFKLVNEERGIAALLDGEERIELLFDRREPHRWTMADAKKWLSRPLMSVTASSMHVVGDSDEIPAPVKEAMEKLKVDGLTPFVVRVDASIGKFEAESGKVNFTKRFYEKFGPAFVGKPYYLGHRGFDSTDYREKIGRILHFSMNGHPSFWINISESADGIRKQIKEDQALEVAAERTGASSVEGWASKTEDHEGYLEPIDFHPSGIALVRKEAATGTGIARVYQ